MSAKIPPIQANIFNQQTNLTNLANITNRPMYLTNRNINVKIPEIKIPYLLPLNFKKVFF